MSKHTDVLHPYDLPDATMRLDKTTPYAYRIWRPAATYVIIGRSNRPETAVYLANTRRDGVIVMQRPTGGQTVVLTPNMVIVSVLRNGPTRLDAKQYFQMYNQCIIRGLLSLNITGLDLDGISDITLNGRKIAGTALYRNPNQVFYHAVINVAESTDLMERYLPFPERVPEYRQGRSHTEFVTSLKQEGYDLNLDDIQHAIARELVDPPDLET